MAKTINYTVLNADNQVDREFPSATALARHIGITVNRMMLRLGGKTIITPEMYESLEKLCYELPDWKHAGKNRKKNG